jgi:alpha-1,6-mannosyltransferase
MSTAVAVPRTASRWKTRALVEIASVPPAAATVIGVTLAAVLGSLWSARSPLNSGTVIAWSLHSRVSSPPLFSSMTAVGFTFVLLFVAAVAWLLTADAARRGRLPVRVAIAGAIALPLLALIPPAILSEDTASYWAYGRILGVYHGNPFVQSPRDYSGPHPYSTDVSYNELAEVWQDIPSTYGPGFIWIAALVARASGTSFATAVFLFKTVALFGILGVSLLIIGATREMRPEERALRLVLWGWNPIVVLYLGGGGHNDAMIAFGLAVSAIGVIDKRPKLAFGGIILGALMKPVALVAAPVYGLWLWKRGSTKDRGVAIAGAAVSALAIGLAYSPYWQGGRALEPLRRIAWRIEEALPVGLLTRLESLAVGGGVATFLARVTSVATLAVLGIWITRHIHLLDPLETIAIGFAGVLLAGTYSQPWYLVWMLVPLCLAGSQAFERWWRPVAILAAIGTVKAVRNQWIFRGKDTSATVEIGIHWAEGALTILLLAAVVQALRQARKGAKSPMFPELASLEAMAPGESSDEVLSALEPISPEALEPVAAKAGQLAALEVAEEVASPNGQPISLATEAGEPIEEIDLTGIERSPSV